MPRKFSDIDPGVLTTITTATMLGLTDESLLALLRAQHGSRIAPRTWAYWKSKHPQVMDAIQDGFANSEHMAARTLWGSMTQERDPGLAFKAAVHWERSRHGRRDVQEQKIDITSSDGSANTVQIYIPDNSRDSVRATAAPPDLDDDED